MARGKASGQPREGKLLDFQNRVSYLQPNSATLPALMEPFTAAADKAERDSYTFWLSLAAATEALETASLGEALWIPREMGWGSSSHASLILLSNPKHSIALPLIFKRTFPHGASQTSSTLLRLISTHRQGFPPCSHCSIQENES